jgi:hypothetical protein
MREAALQEFEEMANKPLASARALPSGLREIGRFRVQIAADCKGADSRPARLRLKANGK